MNEQVYLGMSILDISKIAMYVYWYGYVKLKYRSKAKLCHTDTSSFLAHVKSENVYTEIADAEKRIDSLNYEVNKYTTSHGNKKKWLNLWRMNWMEEQWEFVALRSTMYNYLTIKLS